MVRRSHVVPSSIACCPWWTLGGGALVAAAAVTLSGAPAHRSASNEFDDRASRSVEVFAAERKGEDGPPLAEDVVDEDEANQGTPLRATSPSRRAPEDSRPAPVKPRVGADVPASRFPESVSASRPVGDTSELNGPARVPDAR